MPRCFIMYWCLALLLCQIFIYFQKIKFGSFKLILLNFQ
jgi:hypothetical protein